MVVDVAALQELPGVVAELEPLGCCGISSLLTCPAKTFESIFC